MMVRHEHPTLNGRHQQRRSRRGHQAEGHATEVASGENVEQVSTESEEQANAEAIGATEEQAIPESESNTKQQTKPEVAEQFFASLPTTKRKANASDFKSAPDSGLVVSPDNATE